MNRTTKYGVGLASGVLVAAACVGYSRLPAVLRYVLDGAFFWCMAAVALSVGVLALMYFRKVGTSNRARATLSLSVVLLTVVSSSLFGLVKDKLAMMTPMDETRLHFTFSLLSQIVNALSVVLSYGTAGVALALLIGTFPQTKTTS